MKLKSLKINVSYFGIAPVLVACLLALTLTVMLWPQLLRLHQKYPDPVAGQIIWSDFDKSADMHALLLLTGSAALITLVITALVRATVPADSAAEPHLQTVNQLLLLSLAPAAYRLAAACMNNNDEVPPLVAISAFPVLAVLVIVLLRKYRDQLSSADFFVLGGAFLLAPVMAGFSAMGILLTIARLIPGQALKLAPYVWPFAATAVVVTALVQIVVGVISPTLSKFRERALRCLTACQYPLALLLFYLVPPPLVDASRQFSNPYPKALVAALAIIVLLSWQRMYRRFRSGSIEIDRPLVKAISPVSVVAIMVYVQCGSAQLPTIWHDFFHSGETFVPWQQIWDFHSIPYVDFAPVHGLMEVMHGALNQLFFDGTAANDSAAAILLASCGVAFTALSASELLTPLGALFFLTGLLPGLLPGLDRLYFVAGPLFVVACLRLLCRPVLWLIAWLVVGLFACGYNQAMGPAFVLGTLPVALWQTWRAFRLARWKIIALMLAVGTIAAIVLVIHPLKQVAFGFAYFLLNNAWTNEAANGIAWEQGAWTRDRTWGVGTSQFLWELVRFGWIPAAIGSAVVCWKQFSKPAADRNLPAIALAASIPPTLLLSSVWIIERLDIGSSGKPGVLTSVALFNLIPAVVLLAVPKKQIGLAVLFLAMFVGVIYPWVPTGIDPDFLLKKPCAVRYIAPGTSMVDGRVIGIPRMGQVMRPTPDWTPDLINLKKDLSRLLKPGETYFDLANTTGLYFYMDRRSPAQSAPYVATNSRLQAVMMRQVRQQPVPVVLIAPTNPFDGVPMSIRCYRPYHDFALKYTVLEEDGYMFLVDPSRNPRAGPVGTESQLQRLDSIFRREDLLRLPIAWGDSFAAMRNRFASVARIPDVHKVSISSTTLPALSWTIPPVASSGEAADFLRFHFKFDAANAAAYRKARQTDPPPSDGAEPQLALVWTDKDGKPSAPIRFRGHPGEHLIPLGAYPRWLSGKGFASLTLTLENPNCAKNITVSDIEFLKLKPL